jgi:hypothetical protein
VTDSPADRLNQSKLNDAICIANITPATPHRRRLSIKRSHWYIETAVSIVTTDAATDADGIQLLSLPQVVSFFNGIDNRILDMNPQLMFTLYRHTTNFSTRFHPNFDPPVEWYSVQTKSTVLGRVKKTIAAAADLGKLRHNEYEMAYFLVCWMTAQTSESIYDLAIDTPRDFYILPNSKKQRFFARMLARRPDFFVQFEKKSVMQWIRCRPILHLSTIRDIVRSQCTEPLLNADTAKAMFIRDNEILERTVPSLLGSTCEDYTADMAITQLRKRGIRIDNGETEAIIGAIFDGADDGQTIPAPFSFVDHLPEYNDEEFEPVAEGSTEIYKQIDLDVTRTFSTDPDQCFADPQGPRQIGSGQCDDYRSDCRDLCTILKKYAASPAHSYIQGQSFIVGQLIRAGLPQDRIAKLFKYIVKNHDFRISLLENMHPYFALTKKLLTLSGFYNESLPSHEIWCTSSITYTIASLGMDAPNLSDTPSLRKANEHLLDLCLRIDPSMPFYVRVASMELTEFPSKEDTLLVFTTMQTLQQVQRDFTRPFNKKSAFRKVLKRALELYIECPLRDLIKIYTDTVLPSTPSISDDDEADFHTPFSDSQNGGRSRRRSQQRSHRRKTYKLQK